MLRKSTWSLVILFVSMLLPATLFTQDESSLRQTYNTIDKLLIAKEYEKAIPLIEDLLKTDPQNSNFNFKMAYAILRGHTEIDPIPFLEIAIKNIDPLYKSKYTQPAAPVDALWYYGLQRFYNYEYDEAEKILTQYIAFIPPTHGNYDGCKERIAACSSGREIMKNPVKVKLLDFSEASTLTQSFHSSLFSPDESIFIFTADKNPNSDFYKTNHEAFDDDIFYIFNKDGKWSKPMPLSSNINSTRHEACIGIHSNGKQLLIYREDPDGGNIYYSDMLDSNVWSLPKKFPEPINSTFNESHATLSADGKTIYFTSDREGGFGGLDIYISKLDENGNWGPAINLGPEVNSSYFEESPHIQANSNLLYFSSNRPGGMGEFDIYRCELKKDAIASNIVNIGYPINTPRSDLFFKTSIDGSKAYFSSPCKSTNGEFDFHIVQFEDKKLYPNIIVKGIVITDQGDTLKGLPITLFNITARNITDSSKLDKTTGYYDFKLHSKNNYFASIEYDGDVYYSKPFKFTKYFSDYSFNNTIELDPIILGDSTLKQEIGDFKIFKNNFEKPETDPVFDTIQNAFALVKKLPIQTVSRTNSTISIQTQIVTTPKIADSTPDEIKELTKTPEQPKVEKITQIKEISDVVETPKPVDPKPIATPTNNDADNLLQSGISNFKEGEFTSSIVNMENALKVYDSLNDYKKQIVCLDYLANAQYKTGEINDALEMHKTSLEIIKNNSDKTEVIAKQEEIAQIYTDLHYKEEAISYLEKNLELSKTMKNDAQVSETYSQMADVYLQHNNQEKAIELLEKSLEFSKSQKKKAESLNKIGVSYHQLLQILDAIEYYNKAIQIAAKANDNEGLALYQNNLGNAYYDLKNFEESMIHYKISLGIQKQELNDNGISVSLYNIGNVFRALEKFENAIDNFNQSISYASKLKNNDVLAKNYYALVLTYTAIQNYTLALNFYKKFNDISYAYNKNDDLLFETQVKHQISNKDIQFLKGQMSKSQEFLKFEEQKYEKTLELLAQKEKLLKITRIALTVLVIGIFFLMILLLLRYRTRRKYYKQLSIQNSEIMQKQEEITVQNENLEHLNIELEKLSIVASKTGNAVAILDAMANFEWCNTAFETLYSKQTGSFIDFATNEQEKKSIQECIDSKTSIVFETQRKMSNYTYHWMQCMLTPIVINNEIFKIIAIESDINSQKQAEQKIRIQHTEIQNQSREIEKQRDVAIEQKNEIETQKNAVETTLHELQLTQKKLVEAEKMASLGNLVAGISHEINTPVGIGIAATTSLKSRTENLLELFTSRKMKQSDLDNYLISTQSASQLIQSNLKRTGELVKSFKRVSVDEMTDMKRTFKVNEYFNEIFTSLAAKTNEKNISITINCPEELELHSYPGAFAQMISNMVVNTVAHAFKDRESGAITLSAQIENERFIMSFADNGCGMTAEVVQKVFNPFFTTNMQAGTGLGMNIVYNIVTQKLHGDIHCQSELDKGATFIIDIPLMKEESVS